MSQKWSLGNRKENTVENNLHLESVAQKIMDLLKSDEESISENLFVWTSGWSAWKNYSEVPEICKEVDRLSDMAEEAPPPLDFSSVPPLPTSAPKTFNNTTHEKSVSKEKEPIVSYKKETPSHKVHSTQATAKSNHSVANSHNTHAPASNKNTAAAATSTTMENATAPSSGDSHTKKPLPNPKRKHARVFARFKCIIRSSSLTFRTFTHDISLGGVSLEDEIPADLIGIECMIYIASTKTHTHLKLKIAPTERCVAKYFSFQDADQVILKELSEWIEAHQKLPSAS